MIRLLLDQGLPRSTASLLRRDGWDVVHTGEIGMSNATDSSILSYATSEDRTVLTLDSDFHAMLAVTNAKGPSVIRIRIEGLKGHDLAALIKSIWSKIELPLKDGAMITVTGTAIRIRKLPVHEDDTPANTKYPQD